MFCIEYDSKLNRKQYLAESICNKEPMETVALLFFYCVLPEVSFLIDKFYYFFAIRQDLNQVKRIQKKSEIFPDFFCSDQGHGYGKLFFNIAK